jgi:hypothetical protein
VGVEEDEKCGHKIHDMCDISIIGNGRLSGAVIDHASIRVSIGGLSYLLLIMFQFKPGITEVWGGLHLVKLLFSCCCLTLFYRTRRPG